MMWGTASPGVELTCHSGSAFEALLIVECRLFRSFAENWPLRVLGLLQQYLPKADFVADVSGSSAMGP
jgi:hypothetical protein